MANTTAVVHQDVQCVSYIYIPPEVKYGAASIAIEQSTVMGADVP